MGVVDDDHKVFERPAPQARLWRYLDLSKYLSLLATQSIWFSAANRLGDAFEGSMSRANARLRPQVYRDAKLPDTAFQNMEAARRAARRHHYVSCWHCSDVESAAMWKLYMRDHGLVLTTTYDRLRTALGGEDDIRVGYVHYVDYDEDWIDEGNAFSPFMHKRASFTHEQEVRAVIAHYPKRPVEPPEFGEDGKQVMAIDWDAQTPPGIAIPVDPRALIADVRITPDAPSWFLTAVEDLTHRYGLTVAVLPSDLSGEPSF